MNIDTSLPFPLAYLDWAKEEMGAISIKETERHDWVVRFGQIYSDKGGHVSGLDIAMAKGLSL